MHHNIQSRPLLVDTRSLFCAITFFRFSAYDEFSTCCAGYTRPLHLSLSPAFIVVVFLMASLPRRLKTQGYFLFISEPLHIRWLILGLPFIACYFRFGFTASLSTSVFRSHDMTFHLILFSYFVPFD